MSESDKKVLSGPIGGDLFVPPKGGFQEELNDLINTHPIEGGSNTKDYVLPEFLVGCLSALDFALRETSRVEPKKRFIL